MMVWMGINEKVGWDKVGQGVVEGRAVYGRAAMGKVHLIPSVAR